jgi:hypothetical protein
LSVRLFNAGEEDAAHLAQQIAAWHNVGLSRSFLILDSAGWGDENQLPMKNKSPAGCYGEQKTL